MLLAGLAFFTFAEAQMADRCDAAPAPEEILRRLNETRARGAICHPAGQLRVAAPLRWSESLAVAAQFQSREMAKLNEMGHRDSHERGLAERLRSLDYRFASAVENVAVGYPSLDSVIDAWLASEGHCDNLMSTAMVEIGLACSEGMPRDSLGEVRYWTLVLGAPRRLP